MFESNKTAEMIEFIESTKKNLLKFVPFSLFIVIPFAEFALPFYLYFFPNAFPTSFIFDD
jgi:LETM1 and EF-hand domain-containing protein 1